MAKVLIAIVGSGVEPDDSVRSLARITGRLVAERGWVLVTGGLGGIMEAASEGAAAAGGLVVGILPGIAASEANAWVDIPIATGLRDARNAVLVRAASGVIAVSGEHGTLSEIAMALKFGRPVITLASPWSSIPGTTTVATPAQAVDEMGRLLGERC